MLKREREEALFGLPQPGPHRCVTVSFVLCVWYQGLCVGARGLSCERSVAPGGVSPLSVEKTYRERERHLKCDHSPGLFVASGKKQLTMTMSLFEADVHAGRHPGRYLHRTCLLLREQVLDGVTADKNAIDRHLRVVFDGEGPRLIGAPAARTTETLRRVGNILYTRQFGERLVRELLFCHGGLRTSLNRLQGHSLMSSNLLRVLSVDGTVKSALAFKGYERNIFRTTSANGTNGTEAKELISRVLTVRPLGMSQEQCPLETRVPSAVRRVRLR